MEASIASGDVQTLEVFRYTSNERIHFDNNHSKVNLLLRKKFITFEVTFFYSKQVLLAFYFPYSNFSVYVCEYVMLVIFCCCFHLLFFLKGKFFRYDCIYL